MGAPYPSPQTQDYNYRVRLSQMVDDEFEVRETADGSLTVFHPGYGETYHSRHGALEEAKHVFLREGGVQQRLELGQATRVLEVGFGLGLNFFLTAITALNNNAQLEYVSLEKQLLPERLFHKVDYAGLLGIERLGLQFREWCANEQVWEEGVHSLRFDNGITLTLIIGDAREAAPQGLFDAIYMDAFSPDTNPELWTTAFLQFLADCLSPGGCLTTYSAKGDVRRSLLETGLLVEKRPGPPMKKEMLRACKG